MTDRVKVQRPVVEEGVRRWRAAALILEERSRDVCGRIEALSAAAPWGKDSAGLEFERAFLAGGGPDLLVEQGARLVGETVLTADLVGESVAHVVAADAGLAATTSVDEEPL